MIDNPIIWFTLLPMAGYLCGSIPFGLLIAKLHGVDIRTLGSGNVGATNVARVLSKRWGYSCFILDLLKGFVPSFGAGVVIGCIRFDGSIAMPTLLQQGAWLSVAASAVVGHVFNIWLGFRGGKGVATSLGVGLGVFPYFTLPGLLGFATWIIVTVLSRYVSLGSIVGSSSFLPYFILLHLDELGELWLFATFASVIVILVNVTHRANIARLLAGTENKIGRKKNGDARIAPKP
jgi:glycerol-3-phosphate acyltransferase PlsY